MNLAQPSLRISRAGRRGVLVMTAAAALLLASSQRVRGQSAVHDPGSLGKQRTALYLKATRAPLKDVETDLNHLALVSEGCRAEYGAKSCGLPEKPLGSDQLEERYAYYVKTPAEARLGGRAAKIDRRNWERPSAGDSR